MLKSPVFIEDFSWQEPNAAEAIFVTMLCVEEDPEKVALKTEPESGSAYRATGPGRSAGRCSDEANSMRRWTNLSG